MDDVGIAEVCHEANRVLQRLELGHVVLGARQRRVHHPRRAVRVLGLDQVDDVEGDPVRQLLVFEPGLGLGPVADPAHHQPGGDWMLGGGERGEAGFGSTGTK